MKTATVKPTLASNLFFRGGFEVMIISLALLLVGFSASAADVAACRPTASQPVQFYPGREKIPDSNNLRRKTGSAVFASGQPLLISGRLLDKDCVPMMDTVVEMWQANSYGSYSGSRKKGMQTDSNFAGSGRAVTNNNGEFQFITVYPGNFGSQSPRLFFRVRKSNKVDFNTTIFLEDSPMTYTDATVRKLKAEARQQLMLTAVPYDVDNTNHGYHLDVTLVMGDVQKYREF